MAVTKGVSGTGVGGAPEQTYFRGREGDFDQRDAMRQLQDYVKAKLLPYKYPREIRFIEELPKTGTGKIDRQAVMRM